METNSTKSFLLLSITTTTKSWNILFRSGKLFQQYLVDAYASVEDRWTISGKIKKKTLRYEIYQGKQNAIKKGDTDANAIGKRIILPSSRTGSPRYMIQNYQDAMVICKIYENPDLFVTFTYNPKWYEITRAISIILGQKSEDRLDIIARVFKRWLDQMLAIIKSETILGTIIANLYVIEFQKRWLLNCHFLY